MKKIELRSNGTKRVYTVNDEPSMTDKSQQQSTDVNYIMDKYKKTGQITHLAKVQGNFADLSEITDLHSSMNLVTKAQETFNALPSYLRKRFGNSPIEMVNFLNNPQNDQEAIKLGLKIKIGEETPTPTPTKSSSSAKKPKNAKNDDESNDDE